MIFVVPKEEKQQSNGSKDNRKVVRHCIALERKIRFSINKERLISQKLIYTLFKKERIKAEL